MLVSASEAAARTGVAETPARMITWLRRHRPDAVIATPDGVMVDLDLLAGEPVSLPLSDVVVIERGRFGAQGGTL